VALEVVGFDQLMCDERGSALAAQTCSLCFLWLTDLVQQHPLCDTHAYRGIHGAWPSPVTELPPAVAKSLYGAALPPLRQDALSGADDNVLLGHYTALCKETAAVFLGQMKACECPSLATFNNYTQASLDLRRRYAWSIPTEEALRGIAALGPLLEIGCGTGRRDKFFFNKNPLDRGLILHANLCPIRSRTHGGHAPAICFEKNEIPAPGGPQTYPSGARLSGSVFPDKKTKFCMQT
jgi:hypothetical protein